MFVGPARRDPFAHTDELSGVAGMVDDVGSVSVLARGFFDKRYCCYEIAVFQGIEGLFVTHSGIVD